MRVLVFGDSIAQGFWDSRGGWVQRLRTQYDKESLKDLDGEWHVVFNLGIDGNETSHIIDRINPETEVRRWKSDKLVILIAVGVNDSVMDREDEHSTIEEFSQNYEKLIQLAQKLSDKTLAVGLTSVDDKLCNPWQYSSTGKCFQSDRIQLFDDKIREICTKETLGFVDVLSKFRETAASDELFADGLHPNDKGHDLIASLVKPELDKLLA